MRYGLVVVMVILAISLFTGCGGDDNNTPTESLELPTKEFDQGNAVTQDGTEEPASSSSPESSPSSPPDNISSAQIITDNDIRKTAAKYYTDHSFSQGLQYIYDANDFRIETEVLCDTHRYVFVNLIKGKNSNMLKISRETGELEGYCIFEHVAIDDGEIFDRNGVEYLLLVGHTDHPDYRDEYDSYYGDIREYYAIRYGCFILVPTDGVNSAAGPISGWNIAQVEVQLHEDMNSTITRVSIIDDIVRYEKDWEGLSETGIFEIPLENLF